MYRLFDMIAGEEADNRAQGLVNLVFTDDKRMRRLNRDFRSKDSSTDVLSFNIDEPDDPQAVFGEVYVSVPTARRQAGAYGGTLSEELLRLFCHGLLHLFGFDHHTPADSRQMEQRHDRFMRKLGEASKTP
jgi:probable rRNA maturation factor